MNCGGWAMENCGGNGVNAIYLAEPGLYVRKLDRTTFYLTLC